MNENAHGMQHDPLKLCLSALCVEMGSRITREPMTFDILQHAGTYSHLGTELKVVALVATHGLQVRMPRLALRATTSSFTKAGTWN